MAAEGAQEGVTDKSEKDMLENNNSSANCDCSAGASGNVESPKDAPNSPGQASAPEPSESQELKANTNSGADDSTVQDMEIDTDLQGASSQSEIIENEVSLEESRAQHIADSSNSGISNAGNTGATSSDNAASTSSSNGAASDNETSDTKMAVIIVNDEIQQSQNQQSPPMQQQSTNQRSSGTESFNSFQFWREPLPVIDLENDLQKSPEKRRPDSTQSNQQQSPILISHSAQDATLTTESASYSGDGLTEDSLSVHMANLRSLEEHPEYVANIGSTHVLGQHVSETTMTVVNGVVQGVYTSLRVSQCLINSIFHGNNR